MIKSNSFVPAFVAFMYVFVRACVCVCVCLYVRVSLSFGNRTSVVLLIRFYLQGPIGGLRMRWATKTVRRLRATYLF